MTGRWRRGIVSVMTAGVVCLTAGLAARVTRAQNRERIFVAIEDKAGAPVVDLTASDFAVRIDTTDQEIVSVTRATTPLSVIVITDQLGANSTWSRFSDLRQSLAAFVGALRRGSEDAKIALMTFDRTPRVRATFDSGRAILDRELERLTATDGGSVLLDAVAEAAKAMLRAPSARRVILNVYASYRADDSAMRTNEVGSLLSLSGASLWSLEAVGDLAAGGNFPSAQREMVVGEGGRLSGGTRVTVTSPDQLKPALDRLAALILNQYEVVYGPAHGTRQSQRLLAVRRENVKVLAPVWVARQ